MGIYEVLFVSFGIFFDAYSLGSTNTKFHWYEQNDILDPRAERFSKFLSLLKEYKSAFLQRAM